MGKRANGEGLIRQRADGRWEARVTLPDGKRHSIYGKTQEAVRDQLLTLRQNIREGRAVAANRLTLGAFLTEWLEEVVKVRNAYTTYQSYEGIVRVHVAPALGRHRLAKLTAQQVQVFLNEKAKTSSARIVKYCRDVLRIALGRAVKWRLIAENVAALTEPPRIERTPIAALSREDARAILAAFKGDVLEVPVTLALTLGLRRGEVLGLRWADVDLDQAIITVRFQVQYQGGEWRFRAPKSQESRRTLPAPPFLIETLREHRRRQLAARLALGAAWQDYDLVCPTELGTPQHGMNVTHRFQRGLARKGLPAMRFHALRHGTATLLLAQGVDARTIMEILGHSQISTTLNTYAHVGAELKRGVAERMQVALASG